MYYKTGELAKKANITNRTLRYYDELGLLSPSKLMDNGYRLYDDNDYFKLQKILCLKDLGFELNEIKRMTVTDDYTSINDALNYQLLAIDKQIDHLKLLKENLKSIDKNNLDWSKIVSSVQMNQLSYDLRQQYLDSTNVDIRIKLHDLYSANKESWFKWLFKKYSINKNSKVLEIGCGNGKLWLENKDKIKGDITLSDISKGMITDAKKNLGNGFNYEVFDACAIPYKDKSFDVVIANHMLFYVKDINLVLSEVKRVLKDKGTFYVSTYGSKHMKEVTELVKEFNSKITLSNVNLYDIFGLDNGKVILNKYFSSVETKRYNDHLEVKDSNDLLNYILSCHGNQSEYILNNLDDFRKLLNKKFKNGSFYITKDAGMFIAKK